MYNKFCYVCSSNVFYLFLPRSRKTQENKNRKWLRNWGNSWQTTITSTCSTDCASHSHHRMTTGTTTLDRLGYIHIGKTRKYLTAFPRFGQPRACIAVFQAKGLNHRYIWSRVTCYSLVFPSPQGAGRSLPVDKVVREKIQELAVVHGVITVSEMRTHIKAFVQHNFPNVSTDNRSYYPFNLDICRIIYFARKKANIHYKQPQNPNRRIRTKKYRKKATGWHNRSCAEPQISRPQHSYWPWYFYFLFFEDIWRC